MLVHNPPARGPSNQPSKDSGGVTLSELLLATVILVVTLALAFPEVVFDGKTMQSGGDVAGVLGFDPPYGYEGKVPAGCVPRGPRRLGLAGRTRDCATSGARTATWTLPYGTQTLARAPPLWRICSRRRSIL